MRFSGAPTASLGPSFLNSHPLHSLASLPRDSPLHLMASASLSVLQLQIPLLVALASAHLKVQVWDLLRPVQLLSSSHRERLALDWPPLALGPFLSKSLWLEGSWGEKRELIEQG